jgi:hypothetical protein
MARRDMETNMRRKVMAKVRSEAVMPVILLIPLF